MKTNAKIYVMKADRKPRGQNEMNGFIIDVARTNGGSFFHILLGGRRVASVWSASHSQFIADEISRALGLHANVASMLSHLEAEASCTDAGATHKNSPAP